MPCHRIYNLETMHVVLLNQYYPPDAAPTGVMLEAVVEKIVAQGHQATVICAAGGYAEQSQATTDRSKKWSDCANNPKIIRIAATRFGRGSFLGKLLDYISYYVGVMGCLLWLRPRPDRVVALTTPPYLSLLARIMSKLRHADHAHWVMDVYPDVMVAHGMLREGSLKHRLLVALARWGAGGPRCYAVVTLGPDMAERVGQLFPEAEERGLIRWVPLWSSESEVVMDESENWECDPTYTLRRARGWRDQEFIVMYSGNMGLGHRFGELLEVVSRIANDHTEGSVFPMRCVFFGSGKRRNEIAEWVVRHPDCAVELHDYVSREQLGVHLRSADLHFVSLEPSWSGTMLPSKLQGIFAAARPVVFLGNEKSSLARWVHESGGGWVVQPNDFDGLLEVLREAALVGECKARGLAAQAFARKHFDKEINSRQVMSWMTENAHSDI